MRTALLLLGTLLIGRAMAAEPAPLRMLLSPAWSAPLVEWREGRPQGGLYVELGQALAQQLGRRPQWVLLPLVRIEAAAEAGELDLRCHVEAGAARGPEGLVTPLWALPQVLVGPAGSVALKRSQDLPGAAEIGTVQHQAYPLLDALLGAGQWRRADAPSTDRMLRKLALGRSDYGVASLAELQAYRREQPDPALSDWRLELGSSTMYCQVPRQGRIATAELQGVLQALADQGRLEALQRRHGLPSLAVVSDAASGIDTLGRAELEALFLGRRAELHDGRSPLLLLSNEAVLGAFAEQVLQRSEQQLRSEWARRLFSGRARAPRVVEGVAALKALLRQQPQAIGVLPLREVDVQQRILYQQ